MADFGRAIPLPKLFGGSGAAYRIVRTHLNKSPHGQIDSSRHGHPGRPTSTRVESANLRPPRRRPAAFDSMSAPSVNIARRHSRTLKAPDVSAVLTAFGNVGDAQGRRTWLEPSRGGRDLSAPLERIG